MTLHSSEHSDLPLPPHIEILLSQCNGKVDWHQIFGNKKPVEIEIGSGKGRFIIQRSIAYPDRNYLGIERAQKYFRILKQRVVQSSALNVRLIRTDAAHFIRTYVPLCSVSAYHIYFPDPWPKKRHHKRRLITPEFLAILAATLVPGGSIFFATDFKEYFDLMISHARSCASLQETLCTTVSPSTVNPEYATTHYERKYLLHSRDIFKAAYEKTDTTA